MTMKLNSLHRVEFELAGDVHCGQPGSPARQTLTETIYVANATAMEAVEIASRIISGDRVFFYPWDLKNRYPFKLLTKALVSVTPETQCPVGVNISFAERLEPTVT